MKLTNLFRIIFFIYSLNSFFLMCTELTKVDSVDKIKSNDVVVVKQDKKIKINTNKKSKLKSNEILEKIEI